MADQDPPHNKPFTGQLLPNGETTFRIVGRFGNVNLDDEPNETKAEESSSMTNNSTDRNQKNAEGKQLTQLGMLYMLTTLFLSTHQ